MWRLVLVYLLSAGVAAEGPEFRLSHSLSVQRAAVEAVEQLRSEGALLFRERQSAEAREKFLEALRLAESALEESKLPLQSALQSSYCAAKQGLCAACLKTGHYADAEHVCDELLQSGWLSRAGAAQTLFRRAKARVEMGNILAAARDCKAVAGAGEGKVASRAQDLLELLRAEHGHLELQDEALRVNDAAEARSEGYTSVMPELTPANPLGDLRGLMNPMAALERPDSPAAGFDPSQIMKNVNASAVSKGFKSSLHRLAKKMDDPAFRQTTCNFMERQDPKVWAERVKAISGDDPTIPNLVENVVSKLRSLAQPRRLERLVNYTKRGLWVRKRVLLPLQRVMKAAAPAFPFFVLWLWARLYFKHRLARTLTKGALTGAAAATAMGALMMPEAVGESEDAEVDEIGGEEVDLEQAHDVGRDSTVDDSLIYDDVESEVIEL